MANPLTLRKKDTTWLIITVLSTLAFCVVLLRTFIFKGYDFLSTGIMNDLIRANLPTYYQMYDSVFSGGNFWSWRMGIGTSMFTHADVVFDPFTYILFLGGRDNIQHMFLWYQIAKFLTEAVVCFFYLRYFKLDRPVCSLGAVLYAVSGYSVIMGNNFVLGTICVFCPLYLLGIERFLQEGKAKLLAISLIATCLYSYYFFFISGILCVIYLVIRFLMIKGWKVKELLLLLMKLALMGVVSICLSAFILLPQVQLTMNTARTGSGKDTVMSAEMFFINLECLATAFARSFNLNLLGDAVNTDYYGFRQDYFQFTTYVTAAWIPLAGQYLAGCNWKKRRQFLVVFVLCLLASSTLIFAFITNALSTVNYRWMFILNVILALVCALGVQAVIDHRGFYRKTLYISIVLSLVICALASGYVYHIKKISGAEFYDEALSVLVAMICLVVSDIVLTIGKLVNCKQMMRISAGVAAVLAMFGLCCESALNYRGWYTEEPEKNGVSSAQTLYYDSSYDVIKKIQSEDAGFYRINKDFDSVITSTIDSDNDAMVQAYNGLKSYNSVNNPNYTKFLISNDVYVACPPNVRLFAEAGVSPADIVGADLNFINGVYDRYDLMSYLGVKYYITRDAEKELPAQFRFLYQEQDCYVYLNTEYLPLAFTRNQVFADAAYDDLTTDEKGQILLNAVVVDKEGASDAAVLGASGKMANKHQNAFELLSFDEDRVCFNLDIPTDAKYLATSIPCDSDWSCYINGTEYRTESVNRGMLGVPLDSRLAGQNVSVQFVYRPKAFYLGCVISVATLLVIGVGYVIYRRKGK